MHSGNSNIIMEYMKGVLVIFAVTIPGVTSNTLDACATEELSLECHPGSVILLRAAEYGRLRRGRCIKKDFGFLDCSADVRRYLDPLCSGRQSCTFEVFGTLKDRKPARCSELEAMLEVVFDCVSVVPLDHQQCVAPVSVYDREGFLPSFHMAPHSSSDVVRVSPLDTSTSSADCAVELVAQRGLTWNLTLYDFGRADVSVTSPLGGGGDNSWCTRYAVIRDGNGDNEQNICGQNAQREKIIYLSDTNVVRLDLYLNVDRASYLIAFKAVGCMIPNNPNIVRLNHEGESHTFYCNSTKEKWTIECKDSEWQGDHPSCGSDPTSSEFRTRSRDWNSTTGLLIVIALGLLLGVIIGTTLLGLVICYYKRRYRQPPPVQQMYTGPTYGSGQPKDSTPPLYKTYGKGPERVPAGTAASIEYGRRQPSTDMYKYPYQSCQSGGGQFHAVCLPDHVISAAAAQANRAAHAQLAEEEVTSPRITGPSPIPYKTASDSSSSSDHVYEIPS